MSDIERIQRPVPVGGGRWPPWNCPVCGQKCDSYSLRSNPDKAEFEPCGHRMNAEDIARWMNRARQEIES